MFASPRPLPHMVDRIGLRLLPRPAWLRQASVSCALLPLALAAFTVPNAQATHPAARQAAYRAAPHTARHTPAVAANRSGKVRPAAAPAARVVRRRSAGHAVAYPVTRPGARLGGNTLHLASAGSHRDRGQDPGARQALALAALHRRAALYASGGGTVRAGRTPAPPVPVPASAPVSASALAPSRAPASGSTAEERVRLWYRTHPSQPAAATDLSQTPPVSPVTISPALTASASRPSPVAAARAETPATRPAAAVTTDADDAAYAASRIPSTAPTELEPAPFSHGDLGESLPAPGPRLPADVDRKQPASGSAFHSALPSVPPGSLDLPASAATPNLPAPSAVRSHAPLPDDDLPLAASADPAVNLFDGGGHLVLLGPMKGSHAILVHQNQIAVADGLNRIQDDRDLLTLRRNRLLAALPDDGTSYPDSRLPANRRFARPWTVRFLRNLARAHHVRFGTPLIVTSAARTVEFQRRLVRTNGNAAPPTGDVASPHLYGQAIDIGKRGMGVTELAWMRAYLTPLENDGKIDVEEEFQQSCFHISVYRRYVGLPAPPPQPPQLLLSAAPARQPEAVRPEKKRRRLSTAMLATGLR